MSKYTSEQLKAMAKQVLEAERFGDMGAITLYIQVSMRTGMDPMAVQARIRSLADG